MNHLFFVFISERLSFRLHYCRNQYLVSTFVFVIFCLLVIFGCLFNTIFFFHHFSLMNKLCSLEQSNKFRISATTTKNQFSNFLHHFELIYDLLILFFFKFKPFFCCPILKQMMLMLLVVLKLCFIFQVYITDLIRYFT